MAATAIETALAALAATLEAATTALVIRNVDRPETVPAGGMVLVRDGEQAEVEETLSPLRYHVQHMAEVVVIGSDEATRDTMLKAMSDALIADRTLGGATEWLGIEPISLDLADFEGAEAIRAARMPVMLHYQTLASPAG